MASTKTHETAGELHDKHAPRPEAFSSYQRAIYSALRPPLFSVDPTKWERLARRKVPTANFFYTAGSANQSRTCTANTDAFDRYRLRPRMLVDATVRDCSVELFGRKHASPLLVGPVGVQEIFHRDAEEATARACAAVGVPMVLSTAATRSIEQVAAANGDGERWFQLYWPKPDDDDITVSLLQRAQANGYTALVVTVDTFSLGWRPADLDTAYLPFLWGQGCQIGFSDPVFQRKFAAAQARPSTEPLWNRIKFMARLLLGTRNIFTMFRIIFNARKIRQAMAWIDVVNSGTYRKWADLKLLRDNWTGPIIIKGVQTVADARQAADAGMNGIIISNHGGRQVDGAIASLDALATIAADKDVHASGLTLLFDGGVRTGSDILKALALGAQGVLVGRSYMYGLAIAGQAGVEHVLRCFLADMDNTLGLIGKTSVHDLTRDDLEIVPRTAH